MLFEQYLSKLIEFTEDRALIMSRQSEAFSAFAGGSTVEFCAEFILALGIDHSRSREWPEF